MNIFWEIKSGLLKQSAAALGFFDGVHPGHQAVIKNAVIKGRQMAIPSVLVTFRDHPRMLTTGKSPQLLTILEMRLKLFGELGVDNTLLLTFSEDICRLSPEEYVRQVLIDCLGIRSVSIGYNHTFGRNREGTPDVLKQLGQQHGFDVQVLEPVIDDGVEVSSSAIRQAIESADVALAAKLLGRPYSICGVVAHGDGRGRTIGFPTANLDISSTQLMPANGVYAGICHLSDGRALNAVINLGTRPTVSHANEFVCEVHILDFNESIYALPVTIEFWRYLRSETCFDNIDALKNQIGSDCQTARSVLPGSINLPGPEQRLPA